MLYAILCYNDEATVTSWSKEHEATVMARLGKVQEKPAREGRLGPVARLLPTTAAATIRKGRESMVLDGPFADGTSGYATDGTPVDCVRLASLGLVEGFASDLVVSGINHGANLGDDITYSGTVAAALEGVVLGLHRATDVIGGVTAWRDAGLPVIVGAGQPAGT